MSPSIVLSDKSVSPVTASATAFNVFVLGENSVVFHQKLKVVSVFAVRFLMALSPIFTVP